jgi:hypothetical protein
MTPGDRLPAFIWCAGLGILLGYDIIAYYLHNPIVPTLTAFAVRRIPAPIPITFFVWCLVHFIHRYYRAWH